MRILWLPMWMAAACTPASLTVPLETDFELAPGQPATIAGSKQTIALESVLNDSRCPANVTCIWAGDAEVRLRLSGAGTDTTVMLSQTGSGPRAQVGAHQIELRGIRPSPSAGSAIAQSDYRVTLRVSSR